MTILSPVTGTSLTQYCALQYRGWLSKLKLDVVIMADMWVTLVLRLVIFPNYIGIPWNTRNFFFQITRTLKSRNWIDAGYLTFWDFLCCNEWHNTNQCPWLHLYFNCSLKAELLRLLQDWTGKCTFGGKFATRLSERNENHYHQFSAEITLIIIT